MNTLRTLALVAAFIAPQAFGAGFLTSEEFVAKASAASIAEIELGKLAAQKASTADLRAFAQKMVIEHGKVGQELAALAKAKGLKVETAPSAAQRALLDGLRQKAGRAFDDAYAQQALKDHDEAIALFSAAGTLEDASLAGFARKILPALNEYQQQAARLSIAH